MTIGEAISRIQSLYSKGVPSDDSRLATKLVYNKLLTVRARVSVQELRKNRQFSEWDLQSLDCVEMIPQPAVPCGENKVCKVMRSKYELPSAIAGDDKEGIVVTSIDGFIKFNRTTFDSYKFIAGNKYGSRKQFYFINDNYLYLVNSRVSKLQINAIWRDPIEVYRLNAIYQGNSTCFDNKTVRIYTPIELMESIIELTNLELIQQFNQSREDITNDSNDSLIQETK
jgi:hypothetical protein